MCGPGTVAVWPFPCKALSTLSTLSTCRSRQLLWFKLRWRICTCMKTDRDQWLETSIRSLNVSWSQTCKVENWRLIVSLYAKFQLSKKNAKSTYQSVNQPRLFLCRHTSAEPCLLNLVIKRWCRVSWFQCRSVTSLEDLWGRVTQVSERNRNKCTKYIASIYVNCKRRQHC